MMTSKTILYIGNDLAKKSKYNSTMETLSNLLQKENYIVYKSSNKLNRIVRLLDMIFSTIKYRNKVDYICIDTFSTLNFYYAYLTSQLARFFNIKYIPILHGGNLPQRINTSRKMSKMIFSNAYINIAPSNYLKYEFEKCGFNVKYIPNTLEVQDYQFTQRKTLKPNLLWVRAFADIYNPVLAIEVLHQLKQTFPEAKLCMIGPDRDGAKESVEKKIKELNLENAVEITGVLTKKAWHKKSEEFDVFINTTNIDNTPVSVIEAMALGLPIISTNVGGIPYLIENNVDGILVEKENPKAMVYAIETLIKTNNQQIAINARKKVEKFNWSTVKNDWLEILC